MVFGVTLLSLNIFQLMLALLWIISGAGVIFKKKWSRFLFMAAAGINGLIVGWDFFSGATLGTIRDIIAVRPTWYAPYILFLSVAVQMMLLAVCVSSLYYFTRPHVKECFGE